MADPLPPPLSRTRARGATLLDRARGLRAGQTDAEWRIWYHLRAHRFLGLKFKRQKPLGPYIVDFLCHEPALVIELDGGQHGEQTGYDQQRDAWLRAQGFAVLRLWNHEVLQDTPAVLERIRLEVLALSSSPASGPGETIPGAP